MIFSFRLMFISVIQVIITASITFFFVTSEYKNLSNESLKTLQTFMVQQKEQELKNYTVIALSAIDYLYESADKDNTVTQSLVTNIFDRILYDNGNGYFFVYDDKGVNISHPIQPHRVGKNHWELENDKGEKMIQILIENAKSGGGYYRYNWVKPSLAKETEKLGYSTYLPKWNWMVGTGVYLDDVNKQLTTIQNAIGIHINKTKHIILFVALSSIFAIFSLELFLNFKHKRKSDIKINELSQRLINLQEEERRRISRELHDGIVQILISIKYNLEATKMKLTKIKVEYPESLYTGERNLNTAIHEIRRISHHLHPQILDELGLSSAIEALVVEFGKRTGISVSVKKPAVRKLLPDHVNTTLYRVVQESLTNIERHAHATETTVELFINRRWLTLTISDNGNGMPNIGNQPETPNGIGLRNLAERMAYHSGVFDVKSTQRGTVITAKIATSSFSNYYGRSNLEVVA